MCAFDTAGNLFVCEATNHIVRRIDAATGIITTIAGTGEQGYTGDGGPATEATMVRAIFARHRSRRQRLHRGQAQRRRAQG